MNEREPWYLVFVQGKLLAIFRDFDEAAEFAIEHPGNSVSVENHPGVAFMRVLASERDCVDIEDVLDEEGVEMALVEWVKANPPKMLDDFPE